MWGLSDGMGIWEYLYRALFCSLVEDAFRGCFSYMAAVKTHGLAKILYHGQDIFIGIYHRTPIVLWDFPNRYTRDTMHSIYIRLES